MKTIPNEIKAEICKKFVLGYNITRISSLYNYDRGTISRLINREYLGKVKNPGILTLESKV